MKKILATILLITSLALFTAFIIGSEKSKEVLQIFTPVKFGIDLDKNKTITPEEIICADDIESFSLEPKDEFYNKYSKELKLSKTDMISLGYLAWEYSQKTLQNKKVSLKYTNKVTNECKYANIYINGINYANLLNNSGFGITEGKISNKKNYNEALKTARKLHLVILNHHSNKYHTLECEYGKLAHDTVIIPEKQLPKSAIPCKFCHHNKKVFKHKYGKDIFEIPDIKAPPSVVCSGNITHFYTNFTQHLKPYNKCQTKECTEFLKLINNSNSNIDIAMYGYTEIPAISTALKNARNRGVIIRLVFDEYYNPQKNYYQDNEIIKNIANKSRSDKTSSIKQSDMLMHNKFAIFDNQKVYTGSMNFSNTGLSSYDQNDILIINSKEIANYYEKEFEQMINGKFHHDKIHNEGNNIFKLGSTTVEIYFSPKDKSAARIVQLIQNAKKYIYIPAFLITHTQMSEELINAHKRGVDVKIIIDANSVYTRNTKHSRLRSAGISVKAENYAGKLHSKSVIIDDEYVVSGSMNFSNSGENKNDENTVIIKNGKIAANYKNHFLYLWKMIPDKYLKYNPKPESKDSIGSCSDGIDNNFNGKIDFDEETCR